MIGEMVPVGSTVNFPEITAPASAPAVFLKLKYKSGGLTPPTQSMLVPIALKQASADQSQEGSGAQHISIGNVDAFGLVVEMGTNHIFVGCFVVYV